MAYINESMSTTARSGTAPRPPLPFKVQIRCEAHRHSVRQVVSLNGRRLPKFAHAGRVILVDVDRVDESRCPSNSIRRGWDPIPALSSLREQKMPRRSQRDEICISSSSSLRTNPASSRLLHMFMSIKAIMAFAASVPTLAQEPSGPVVY